MFKKLSVFCNVSSVFGQFRRHGAKSWKSGWVSENYGSSLGVLREIKTFEAFMEGKL